MNGRKLNPRADTGESFTCELNILKLGHRKFRLIQIKINHGEIGDG